MVDRRYVLQLQASIEAYRILANNGQPEYYSKLAELEVELQRCTNTGNLEEDNKDLINKFYSNY